MAHWYKPVEQIGPHSWSAVRYFNRKKDGTVSKVVKTKEAIADGAIRSVTDILSRSGDAGGLIRWSAGLGIQAGLLMASAEGPDDNRLELAWEKYNELSSLAPDKGRNIHQAIDAWIGRGAVPQTPVEVAAVKAIEGFLKENHIDVRQGRSEVCAVYDDGEMRFGGTADYCTPKVLLDWKTVQKPRKIYAAEVAQVAAYARAFNVDDDCWFANVYISQETGEIIRVQPYDLSAMHLGWELFGLCYRADEVQNAIEGAVNE
jgi:hypothetical protein